jgi:hypothetical protein
MKKLLILLAVLCSGVLWVQAETITDEITISNLSNSTSYSNTTYTSSTTGIQYSSRVLKNGSKMQIEKSSIFLSVASNPKNAILTKVQLTYTSDTARDIVLYTYNQGYTITEKTTEALSGSTQTATLTSSSTSYSFAANATNYYFYLKNATSNAAYLSKIEVTWDVPTDNRADSGLAVPTDVQTINIGETLANPLTNTNNITDITYVSSNTTVASVDENGDVKGLAKGTATIKATFAGNDTYQSFEKSYSVKVVDPNAPDVTFDFANPGTLSPAQKENAQIAGTTFTAGSITLDTTNGSTNTKIYSESLRIYKDATLTIAAASDQPNVLINSIVFTFNGSSNNNISLAEGQAGTLSSDKTTWTGSATSVKFSMTGTTRIETVTVTYSISNLKSPEITVDNDFNVNITQSDGADIYYTIDGSDPQTSETAVLFSDPFAVSETCTVSARAKKDNEWSAMVTELIAVPARSLAAFMAAQPTESLGLACPLTVIHDAAVSTKARMTVVTDGSTYAILQDASTSSNAFKQGNVIPAGIKGVYGTYNQMPVITSITNIGEITTGGEFETPEITSAAITIDNVNTFGVIKNVSFTLSNKTMTCTDADGNKFTGYNEFLLDNLADAEDVNIVGIVGRYNTGAQFWPISITKNTTKPTLGELKATMPDGSAITEGESYTINVGEKLTFSAENATKILVRNVDKEEITEGTEFDADTYTLTWTPAAMSEEDITVLASIGDGDNDPQASIYFTLTVNKKAATLTWKQDDAEVTAIEHTLGKDFTAPTLTVDPEEAASAVQYSSSDTDVADFVDGTLTIKAAGTTTITAAIADDATYNDASASYTLTVNKATATLEWMFEEAVVNDKTVTVTESSNLFPTLSYSDGIQPSEITLTADNEEVCLIDWVDDAVFAAYGVGTTKITASFAGNDKYNEQTATFTLVVNLDENGSHTFDFTQSNEMNFENFKVSGGEYKEETLSVAASQEIMINTTDETMGISSITIVTNNNTFSEEPSKYEATYSEGGSEGNGTFQLNGDQLIWTTPDNTLADIVTITAPNAVNIKTIDIAWEWITPVFVSKSVSDDKVLTLQVKNGHKVYYKILSSDNSSTKTNAPAFKAADLTGLTEAGLENDGWTVNDNSYTYKLSDLATTDLMTVYAVNGTKQSEEVTYNQGGQIVSGIEGVAADSQDAPVEYYNLQGVRVSNPGTGLYIRRQGTKVEKVAIR